MQFNNRSPTPTRKNWLLMTKQKGSYPVRILHIRMDWWDRKQLNIFTLCLICMMKTNACISTVPLLRYNWLTSPSLFDSSRGACVIVIFSEIYRGWNSVLKIPHVSSPTSFPCSYCLSAQLNATEWFASAAYVEDYICVKWLTFPLNFDSFLLVL